MKTTLINEDLTLVVEDAIPASTVYSPEEILALAVCASPNGSTDPGDLALLHAARERGIQLNYAQQADSWEAPSGERHYSTAILKAADKEDAVPFMVARGNLNALEKLCEVSNLEKERMNKAFEAYDPSGFQPVGIAVHLSLIHISTAPSCRAGPTLRPLPSPYPLLRLRPEKCQSRPRRLPPRKPRYGGSLSPAFPLPSSST